MDRVPRELSREECEQLISGGGVGRIGLCLPDGPRIYPVNFVVHDRSVVFRTTAYSELSKHSWGSTVAFEVDELHPDSATAWSVLAIGRAVPIDDPDEIALLERRAELRPWAGGRKQLHLRITPTQVTGRAIGIPSTG